MDKCVGGVGTKPVRVISVLLLLLLVLLLVLGVSVKCQDYELKGTKYPLILWPFLDQLDIPQAFSRKNYLRFLFKCVFFEGHCDIIGKWLKPRAIAALFGTCLVCTPFQAGKMELWLGELINRNPILFRAAMVKVCYDLELPIDPSDLQLLQPFLKNSTNTNTGGYRASV